MTFHSVGNFIIPTDEVHHFSVETTNQMSFWYNFETVPCTCKHLPLDEHGHVVPLCHGNPCSWPMFPWNPGGGHPHIDHVKKNWPEIKKSHGMTPGDTMMGKKHGNTPFGDHHCTAPNYPWFLLMAELIPKKGLPLRWSSSPVRDVLGGPCRSACSSWDEIRDEDHVLRESMSLP